MKHTELKQKVLSKPDTKAAYQGMNKSIVLTSKQSKQIDKMASEGRLRLKLM